MSSTSDNNLRNDRSSSTVLTMEELDLNRISSTLIPFQDDVSYLNDQGYKIWRLNYDHYKLRMPNITTMSQKEELLIKGCEMYSSGGIRDLMFSGDQVRKHKRLSGYIAPSDISAHDWFKLRLDKLFLDSNTLSNGFRLENPLKRRDEKLNYVTFNIDSNSKFYDLNENILDHDNLSKVPIRFIPTASIKVFMSPHTTKLMLLITEATVTHIGKVHDEPPEHFESLKIPIVKPSKVVDLKQNVSNYNIGESWTHHITIVDYLSLGVVGIYSVAAIWCLLRKE